MITNPMAYVMDEEVEEETSAYEDDSDNTEIQETKDSTFVSDNIAVLKSNVSSDSDLVKLSSEVNEAFSKKGTDAVVVIHQKATIEEVSYFISLTTKHDKPIIFIPVLDTEDDVSAKMEAVRSYINDATDLTDDTIVVVTGQGENAFDITGIKNLPTVNIVYDYTGNDGSAMQNVLKYDEGVVIVASSEDGSLSDKILEYVTGKYAFPIVISYSGREYTKPLENSYNDRNVFYTDKSPVKARILLMLSLNKGCSTGEIRQNFYNY